MTPLNTILLAEDNEDDAELCLRMLRKERIANEVVVARDGVEALELLGLRPGGRDPLRALPSVMLLDLKMPRIDGQEVLRAVRADKRTEFLPVVVFSSSREEKDLVESYSNGANSYVLKPVDVDQLAAAIRQLGLYWLLINQPPPGSARA